MSVDRIKADVFTGPQIRRLVNDEAFERSMNRRERLAWQACVDVQRNLLGNHKAPDYEEKARNLVRRFFEIGGNMSVKLHFIASHIDEFPDNCGDYSEEMGERFHQDLKTMEDRYKGRWDVAMLADYCWNLTTHKRKATHKRKSYKMSFLGR